MSNSVHQSTPSPNRKGKQKRIDLIEPQNESSPKRQRVLSSATRIFILADKLTTEEHDALRSLVVDLGGMNANMTFANVILTSMRAPRRIERYLNADVINRHVPVLHTSWLHDSARERLLLAYEPYKIMGGASPELEKQREELGLDVVGSSEHEQTEEKKAIPPPSPPHSDSQTLQEETNDDDSQTEDEDDATFQRALTPFQSTQQEDCEGDPDWKNVDYACMRPSPLKSKQNQALVDELEVLRLQRILAGKQEMNATAYGRAISAIKAYPHSLQPNPSNAKNLKGVGPKIAKLIVQYYEEGRIAEVDAIRKDSAFQTMSRFMQLYGVGPKRAREYYSGGARSMDDVIKMGGSLGVHLHIDECLRILPDLQRTIPRLEVEEISKTIFDELNIIAPGSTYVICGGYRRGKPESNDVDIVISLPRPLQRGEEPDRGIWNVKEQIAVMDKLLKTLKRKAFITHVVNVSTPASVYEMTYSRLELAEVVVMPSRSETIPVPRYRRVDIILGPWETHGAAVLGWTGSRQFERDIRLLAKHKGFTFHSTGLVHQGERAPLSTPQEEDIFEILGLEYMPPRLRNCDA
ncbi:Nucleotidyltransferase [Meira miltonrushii]|uniref:DNA polymerase n=1 Tax=Meira miltonrushii TaxID=1280837 RepID=A0A316VQ66_9BASI|nr:Nucleotidyltransferase [Meira miltonrushii]PWN38563.1 Nucleotidyltransferase [Meira miltonrushii]